MRSIACGEPREGGSPPLRVGGLGVPVGNVMSFLLLSRSRGISIDARLQLISTRHSSSSNRQLATERVQIGE